MGLFPLRRPINRTLNTIKWNGALNIEESSGVQDSCLIGYIRNRGRCYLTDPILDPDDGVITPDRDADTVDGVYPVYTNIDAAGGGAGTPLEADSDASIYAVRSRNVDVEFITTDDRCHSGGNSH